MTKRNLCFVFATLIAVVLYWTPLKTLATFSFGSDIYSYATVIPLFSAFLIYLEKERIFSRVRYDLGIGLIILFLALIIRSYYQWHSAARSSNDSLSLVILSFVVLWIGVFVLCYGTETLRAAAFPLSLLLLMVPLPQAFLERSIFVLRGCSAQAAAFLLRLGGVPVFQNGFRLSLPGTDVEVAEQCSGIRSCLALFITSLLMGYLFLRSPWRRLWLVLAIFPVTILKNGLRIVTIYGLTIHPGLGALTLWMHRYGGIPFSFLGLSLLAFFVASLHRFEETSTGSRWIITGGNEFEKERQIRLSN
ncbi:MAG: exosortase/archaeosortase family protein [Terriglobia bacterium]|jgi:exosortase